MADDKTPPSRTATTTTTTTAKRKSPPTTKAGTTTTTTAKKDDKSPSTGTTTPPKTTSGVSIDDLVAAASAGSAGRLIEQTDRNTFVRTDGKPFTTEQLVQLAAQLGVLGNVPLRQRQRPDGKWETLKPDDTAMRPGRGSSTTAAEWTMGRTRPPIYSIGDVTRIFGRMSPEARWTVLKELHNIGLLATDPAKLPNSTSNNTVAGAIADLLYEANIRGTTWDDALAQLRMEAMQAGTYGQVRKRAEVPLTVRLTNPADIKTVADYAAQRVLGRRLTTEELQQVIDAQHAAERTAATAAWDAAHGSATGGEVIEAPSPEGTLDQVIGKSAALSKERQQMGMVQTMLNFFNILDSPVG